MYLLTLITIGLQNLFFPSLNFNIWIVFSVFGYWLFFLYPQCSINSAFSTAPSLLFLRSDALSLVSGSLVLILICGPSCYPGIQSNAWVWLNSTDPRRLSPFSPDQFSHFCIFINVDFYSFKLRNFILFFHPLSDHFPSALSHFLVFYLLILWG